MIQLRWVVWDGAPFGSNQTQLRSTITVTGGGFTVSFLPADPEEPSKLLTPQSSRWSMRWGSCSDPNRGPCWTRWPECLSRYRTKTNKSPRIPKLYGKIIVENWIINKVGHQPWNCWVWLEKLLRPGTLISEECREVSNDKNARDSKNNSESSVKEKKKSKARWYIVRLINLETNISHLSSSLLQPHHVAAPRKTK